jgi:hypothetical protein
VKSAYKPLEYTPHLSLEFAQLTEQWNSMEALTAWISKCGLLGLHAVAIHELSSGANNCVRFVDALAGTQ